MGSPTTRTHTRVLNMTDLLALSWQRRWIPYSSRTRPWSSTSEVQQRSSSRCVYFIAGLTSSPPFISLPFVQTLPLPSHRGRHLRTHLPRSPTLLLQHLQHHRRRPTRCCSAGIVPGGRQQQVSRRRGGAVVATFLSPGSSDDFLASLRARTFLLLLLFSTRLPRSKY